MRWFIVDRTLSFKYEAFKRLAPIYWTISNVHIILSLPSLLWPKLPKYLNVFEIEEQHVSTSDSWLITSDLCRKKPIPSLHASLCVSFEVTSSTFTYCHGNSFTINKFFHKSFSVFFWIGSMIKRWNNRQPMLLHEEMDDFLYWKELQERKQRQRVAWVDDTHQLTFRFH